MGSSCTRSLQGPRLGSDGGSEPQAWPLTRLTGPSWDQPSGLAAPDVAHPLGTPRAAASGDAPDLHFGTPGASCALRLLPAGSVVPGSSLNAVGNHSGRASWACSPDHCVRVGELLNLCVPSPGPPPPRLSTGVTVVFGAPHRGLREQRRAGPSVALFKPEPLSAHLHLHFWFPSDPHLYIDSSAACPDPRCERDGHLGFCAGNYTSCFPQWPWPRVL